MPLDNDTPFAKGAELIVNIPISPHGTLDLYMDNIINLMVNIPRADHVARGQVAALLAINICTWPNHPEETIPCKSMDTRDKLMAEAGITETKMKLGWEFDFW
jgi:hypothetical protein